jgi:hypothetical protein
MSQGFRGTAQARAAGAIPPRAAARKSKALLPDLDSMTLTPRSPNFGGFTLDHGLAVPPVVAPRFQVIRAQREASVIYAKARTQFEARSARASGK